ncbi:hypothetical protein BDV33DRAFT_200990 [Aspergillus novoparasiticus]|uniref:Carboxylesterase type B domain-containing protein n=1 Tax=Aspergillus novoparasiticus TaxID=986946 RepID=A0A5N6EZ78_9EURO|nr:hypothetical protein BDV33DRAFT_200990 [Aspergillus novoparasiticus]
MVVVSSHVSIDIIWTQCPVLEGIPYAEPPLGELRFMPPHPLPPQSGKVINATTDPDRCVQFTLAPYGFYNSYLGPGSPGTEDCLKLYVWKPVKAVEAWPSSGENLVVRRPTWEFTCTISPTWASCMFGPNTFPAHNSVLFASEVEVEYLARTLIAPLIDGQILTREVKATAENQWVNSLQTELKGSVFEAGCSNWYINRHGRNSASWPGYASSYWKETWKSQVGLFKDIPRSHFWFLNTLWRWVRTTSKYTYGLLFIPLAALLWRSEGGSSLQLSQLHRNAMYLFSIAH